MVKLISTAEHMSIDISNSLVFLEHINKDSIRLKYYEQYMNSLIVIATIKTFCTSDR